jgi:glycosyltransferase involved in cell wall biosynthesis
MPRVTAVMLAYGAEPWLAEAVTAVLASAGVDVEVIVVDNGCTSDAVDRVKGLDRLRVITPDANTGYAGGCDRGAAEASGDFLAFVNSDAIVAPGALALLADVAAEPAVGLAMGSIRLADAPELMNTAGNPVHYTGLSWAGGFNEPASRYARRRPVTAASGCCFAIRRELWRELGGFAEEYFAYCEDTDEYVPDAIVLHHYEFSRNTRKFYLLERNRAILVLTTYQRRSLLVLAPMLLLTELLMLGAAIAGGWGRAKLRGWRWLWQHRDWLGIRRALIQRERAVPDAEISRHLTARLDPANVAAPPGVGILNAFMRTYWLVARRLL